MRKLLLGLLLATTAFAQTDGSKVLTGSAQPPLPFNILPQPGFENRTTGWSVTSGTFTTTQAVASVARGRFSASWIIPASTTSGLILESDPITIPAGLFGRQCYATILSKGNATTNGAMYLEAFDETDTYGNKSIADSPTYIKTSSEVFTCPTSGTLRLRVRTTALSPASPTPVFFDEAFLGDAESNGNGGLFDVTATEFIGAAGTVLFGAASRQLIYIEGSAGPVTADTTTPLTPGIIDGQEVYLVGRDATNTVTIDNSGNVALKSASITLGLNDVASFEWDAVNSIWVQTSVPIGGSISNSMLAPMASNTIKGNNAGGLAAPSDLSVAQVNAILPVFTSSLNGLAPLSGGGTSNFLRADGSWASPSGTGVTSVGFTVPATSIFAVTGTNPVTSTGSFGFSVTGNSGGIPYFNSSASLSTSALLVANALMLGGGASIAPSTLGSLGTTTTVLHGNAAGAPTFGAVSLTADVSGIAPVANGGTGLSNGSNLLPPGVIMPYGGASAPTGWLLCDGSAVSRTGANAALFAIVGTAYGVGNGTTTFNVPNGQAMFLRGAGSQTVGGVSYSGPSLGATQADSMQGHQHSYQRANHTTDALAGATRVTSIDDSAANTGSPITDGTNGTPRTSTETRGVNIGINYIIKL